MSVIEKRPIAWITLALVVLAPRLPAQSTFATITGVATDPNGAFVPGVKVEAVHLATNYRYAATTNDAGQYTLPNLREGVYRMKALLPRDKPVSLPPRRTSTRGWTTRMTGGYCYI